MSTPHIEHFVDERGNFICRAEFEGSFLSKDEAKELSKYVSGILAENAKLRELCSDMLMCLTWQIEPHGYMMDGCDHCRYRGKTNGMCGLGMFRGRARELGIEVDA